METEKTTVTNHYYHGGINFIGCNMPGATFQTVNPTPAAEASTPPAADTPVTSTTLPDSLTTPAAHDLLHRLTEAGLVDKAWQPIGLSLARRGVLASLLAQKLDIPHTWKTFGQLWGMKADTLRAKYNEGMNQDRMNEFISQINNVLR